MASVGYPNPVPAEIHVQQPALRPCEHIISIHLRCAVTKLESSRSLLRGEPTQILTYKKRHEREELLAAVKAELERSGRTIDITPKEEDSSTTNNSSPQGGVEQNGRCT